jgi:ATP phosphoribosyltransferase regulatory subunit
MNDDEPSLALLPAGLTDQLPPRAAQEAMVIHHLMATCAGYGYERVKPPLVEFEDSLLAGPGQSLARQTFRLMDPQSQRMMGVRADMTVQVARIAGTRLGSVPRPLRLSYAGSVLRVSGSQLRNDRQFTQAGFELIGTEALAGDAEVVQVAAEALTSLGIKDLSIDLTMPTFVPTICRGLGLSADESEKIRDLLDRKDAAGLEAIGGIAAKTFAPILAAAGEADTGLEKLSALSISGEAELLRAGVASLTEILKTRIPGVALTIDPGEYRGFEYESGTCFTLFAKDVRGELGRGGRYRLQNGEPAVGVSIYLDSIMRALPAPAPEQKIYLPADTPIDAAARLREEGWRTVQGMEPDSDSQASAKALSCTHIFSKGEARLLD